MAYQTVVRYPAFVSFDDKFRAQFNVSASGLISEEARTALLMFDIKKKRIVIFSMEMNNGGRKICHKLTHKTILINLGGKHYLEQFGLNLEKIKLKRFKVTGENGTRLIIHLTKPLR